jgi:hypothetical protein
MNVLFLLTKFILEPINKLHLSKDLVNNIFSFKNENEVANFNN